MRKLDKRAISILVIATFLLSMIPIMPAQAQLLTPVLTPSTDGKYGQVIVVNGLAGGATSGATIEIYWDTAIGENAWLLNSTTAKADGSYEVWFDVPEAVTGDHYVWAKDTSGPFYEKSIVFKVLPLVKPSPTSGLPGDKVTANLYGFSAETKIDVLMEEQGTSTEIIGTGNGIITTFTGFLTNLPVAPTTVSITDGTQVVGDNGVGGLSGAGTGSIDYITGAYSVTFTAPPAAAATITANYVWAGTFTIQAIDTVETDELGSFTKDFNVPSLLYGDYFITANITAPSNPIQATFIIGASITVTPEEGPTGTIVTVSGKGWTYGNIMTFRKKVGGMPILVVEGAVITVGSTGKFSADVVIPKLGTEGDYYIEAVETGPGAKAPSSDSFELTGLPEIVVSPTYGSPGATITVTGSNFTQIAGLDVIVTMNTAPTTTQLVIAETKSDGTFEETFMSPAVTFKGYTVTATDYYSITETDSFKVGLIALIINPTYGGAGTKTSITGIGFAPGDYNVTFGTKLYEDYSTVIGEAISDPFYVPNVEPGTYELTITDQDENELSTIFTVTAVTEVTLDPAKAPNDYNVTIEGVNFADKGGSVEFIIYNVTADGEVDFEEEMDVNTWTGGTGGNDVTTVTDDDGNFTGHWHVLPDDEMSIGDYTINVTGTEDFLIQVPFSVVAARVDVAPRKVLFDRGDTIQFNVKNDFDFKESYMRIWDPYDNLYWQTELFKDWVKSAGLYTVPYYLQTSGMNPMELTQDAPIGTWFYVFYEEGTTQLVNGTFEVGLSSAAKIGDMLEEVSSDLAGISDDVADMGDDFAEDMAALEESMASDIDSITDDIAGLSNDIAQATDAGQSALDAVDDLAESMSDMGDAVSDIADIAADTADATQDAVDAANDAVQAANDANDSATGLTTLVYGAIAASLIAALAAIVSLMQISKRIAG